ncbi:subtilisin-like protease SBT1.5 [Dioscorea cayenensis subsp. rotundata]|uniref:Subtilisin-like protease SBT1.5 n=1 Tax=Dioscorea cayennensis subsp. rotundata TaxID=55577 RepID=A0AB40BIX6_DIOCR|nr:subtilisin-like protease SBT1.5 [Dioscorea cayenensis subsp. rotundata]
MASPLSSPLLKLILSVFFPASSPFSPTILTLSTPLTPPISSTFSPLPTSPTPFSPLPSLAPPPSSLLSTPVSTLSILLSTTPTSHQSLLTGPASANLVLSSLPSSCSRKLIGARFFFSGARHSTTETANSSDVLSPYDSTGHGTHTASTAAGRPTSPASLYGYAAGIASGVAPNARIAVYKVCWSSGCFDSDILAALDAAVRDGADVISLSVGSGVKPYHLDPIAIGALGAVEHGVVVVVSAGNDGPAESTVTNVAPWMITVGAGTMDRRFPVQIRLDSGLVLAGDGIWTGTALKPETSYPLIYGGDSSSRLGIRASAALCAKGSLDPTAVKGRIVLCERGGVPRAEKGLAVKEAGGVGMILANQSPDGNGVIPDPHVLPAAAVGFHAGEQLKSYIKAAGSSAACQLIFGATQLNVTPAPTLAAFSARGPNAESAYVIKPDVIAPGVGILAAWPDNVGPTELPADKRQTEFNVLTGTSMACPHVSGISALLKTAHPEWSPAMIRSALMTTAYIDDNRGNKIIDESSGENANPWGLGSGHIDPEKANNPGLVYDITIDDYIQFLCSSNYSRRNIKSVARGNISRCSKPLKRVSDINYPSISIVFEQQTARKIETVVYRTMTSVRNETMEYQVSVSAPETVEVVVVPEKLRFERKGDKKGFMVRVSGDRIMLSPGSSKTVFGSLTWNLTSTIVFVSLPQLRTHSGSGVPQVQSHNPETLLLNVVQRRKAMQLRLKRSLLRRPTSSSSSSLPLHHLFLPFTYFLFVPS